MWVIFYVLGFELGVGSRFGLDFSVSVIFFLVLIVGFNDLLV